MSLLRIRIRIPNMDPDHPRAPNQCGSGCETLHTVDHTPSKRYASLKSETCLFFSSSKDNSDKNVQFMQEATWLPPGLP
jgi:hypothetical protein